MINISRKLSRKLSLAIMLMAMLIFVVSLGFLFLQSRYLIRQEAMERSNSILNTTMLRIRNYMTTIETSVNANAWLIEENFTPDSLESVTRRILRLNPHILSCSVSTEPGVFPKYGRHFSVYTAYEGDSIVSVQDTEYDYFDRSWYKSALQSGKPTWVEPFGEHTEGTIDYNEAVASYCRPIYLTGGRLAGVLSADLSFNRLAEAINSVELPYPNAHIVLVGSDGRYFIHPDSTRLFRKTIFTDADPTRNADIIALGHEMTGGKQGVMHATINGQFCHVSYRPVRGTDWSIALVSPDSEILTDYNKLAYVVVIVILLGLLVILWLSHRVVRQFISPIYDLLGMTRKISKGSYDEVIPFSDRTDTIGRLQNSFATMQQSLQDNIGRIRQAAEELKQRNESHVYDIEVAETVSRRKDMFISNVSHQIRTPLNIILGFVSVLHDSLAAHNYNPATIDKLEEDNLSEITSLMMRNAIVLKRMVLMLYDSSETGASEENKCKREDELSCNAIAREAIEYTQLHYPDVPIRFETEVPDELYIVTNRLYLTRTIRELLYNAVKHSDRQNIVLRVVMADTMVQFIIQDTGPGMHENAQSLMESPFSKLNESSEGLGLGLPLSKRHAKNLGGDLIYDGTYLEGCRLILELPR